METVKDSVSKNHDPLKWFGILVPQTLRQSSQCFEKALEMTLEIANLQIEGGSVAVSLEDQPLLVHRPLGMGVVSLLVGVLLFA